MTSYARALILPALIGICLHFKSPAFVQSPVISILLIGWAVIFIERWKSTSNRLSATISASTSSGIRASITHSADGVAEARVAENVPMNPRTTVQTPWWVVEARASLSIPFVLASALFVYFNMTVAFFLEAFIAKLYDGPFSFLAVRTELISMHRFYYSSIHAIASRAYNLQRRYHAPFCCHLYCTRTQNHCLGRPFDAAIQRQVFTPQNSPCPFHSRFLCPDFECICLHSFWGGIDDILPHDALRDAFIRV